MSLTWREMGQRTGVVALMVAAVLVVLAVAFLVPYRPMIALGIAGVVLVGVLATVNPVTLPMLAMPLIVVVERVGGGGRDLTVSDAVLFLAFWPAVLLAPRPFSRALRGLLWFNALYQASTLFTVMANPYPANTVEWFHAWLLISGALVVGWAVGATGNARLGVGLFLFASLALAVPTIVEGGLRWASGDFSPVYPTWPWSMHKNYLGTLMCFAALVAYADPLWLGWKRWATHSVFWIFLGALAMTQARQALVGLTVGILVLSLRGGSPRRRSVMAVLALGPLLLAALSLLREQIASGNRFNSAFQRLEWYDQSLELWWQAPMVGHGLRYWAANRTQYDFQPPQVFLESLAQSGLVGTIGLVIMLVGSLVVLWKLDHMWGTLPFALLASRVAQGQLDLFWVSPTASIPLLLVGVILGTAVVRRPSTVLVEAGRAGARL